LFPDKIKITDDLIKLIIDTRKEYNLTAYGLSEKIGKNKSWLPNIENKRTKNIFKEDLILLFKDFAKDKNMDAEDFIIKYLSPAASIELSNNVTVPNHYLQAEMHLFSPDHEDLNISDEERMKRMEYYTEEKPYEVDLVRLKKKLKDLSELIIDEFSYCQTASDRYKMIDMAETMYTNFLGGFAYTRKLYQIPLFQGDAEMSFGKKVGSEYLKDTHKNIVDFSLTQKLAYAHADICSEISFEENRHNLFANIMLVSEKTDTEVLDNIMFDLDGFIYKLHEYILAAKGMSKARNCPSDIDFIAIFEHIVKTIKDFIRNAHLNYRFEYTIPESDTDLDELAKRCLELNNITYGIKQAIRNRRQ
jgi:transcriptional regulator with XRE-family HTH domain